MPPLYTLHSPWNGIFGGGGWGGLKSPYRCELKAPFMKERSTLLEFTVGITSLILRNSNGSFIDSGIAGKRCKSNPRTETTAICDSRLRSRLCCGPFSVRLGESFHIDELIQEQGL